MIIKKTPVEIAKMREANRICAEVLEYLRPMVQPGITTIELDMEAETFITSRGAIPAFKGYHGYPKTLCTAINNEVIHGIPSDRKLKEGDIIGLDVGTLWNNYYGDSAVTLPVGNVSKKAAEIIKTAEQALYDGIAQAVAGNRLYDISAAIQKTVEAAGFSVIRDFVGHGVGRKLHEDPQIPNFGKKGTGPILEEGMTLALEPMINQGSWRVKILKDGWTAVTHDGQLSAHFEHSIAITADGPPVILSKL